MSFWQDFAQQFHTAFIEGDRWKLYLQGVGVTLQLTVAALIIGVILGVVVAVIRTAHDQQRLGRRNFFLGLLNIICKIYTTIIRAPPVVQLLIWDFVIFKTSRVTPWWASSVWASTRVPMCPRSSGAA